MLSLLSRVFSKADKPEQGKHLVGDQVADLPSARGRTRALLAGIVAEGMLRTGVLSHQYKFRMLNVDRDGQSHCILIEVATGAQEVGEYRQGQCELWVRHTADLRHKINVVSVYWRRERAPGFLGKRVIPSTPDGDLSETHYAGLS